MNNWQGRVILFFVIGLGSMVSLQYSISHFKSDRQILLLNTTRPDFYGFLDAEKQQPTVYSKDSLREYFDYFHLVNEAIPDNHEGLLMLGYLNEITGDWPQAQVFLNKAYQLDPSFFFTGFNLALVLYRQGDYLQSTQLLQKALEIPPDRTLNRMMSSTIYRQFFLSMKDKSAIIVNLRQSYHDAYVLLIEALEKQKGLQGENVNPPIFARIM